MRRRSRELLRSYPTHVVVSERQNERAPGVPLTPAFISNARRCIGTPEWRSRTGVVLVEHDVPLLRAACDRLVALDRGRVLASGRPAEVLDDPAVVAAYLGTPVASGVAAVSQP